MARSKWSAMAAVVLAVAVGVVEASHAQGLARGRLGVEPSKQDGEFNVDLYITRVSSNESLPDGLRGNEGSLRIGEEVTVCFEVNRRGYVTLWSKDDSDPEPTLIYPNERSHPAGTRAVPVESGRRACVGDGSQNFALTVRGPVGGTEVYLHYTEREDLQFGQDAFPQIGRGNLHVEPDAEVTNPYASATVRFQTVN